MSCTVSRKVKVLPVEDVSMKLGLLRILLESCSPINIVYYILLPYLPSVCVWYGLRRERRGRVVGGGLVGVIKAPGRRIYTQAVRGVTNCSVLPHTIWYLCYNYYCHYLSPNPTASKPSLSVLFVCHAPVIRGAPQQIIV